MNAGNSKSCGFTLIELLVTIAVIVIMATIAVPNFSSMIASNRLAAEYNNVLTGLHFARSEAVKRRNVVRAEISSDSGGWKMEVMYGADVLRTFSSTNGSVIVNGGNTDAVEFNGLGRRDSCTFTSCTIDIGDKAIEVNAAGNIKRAKS
ncbi:GspH/FimT family pseudopilin [Halomonas lysinitropha]|uniref:GspH/FimT family pseudopilin n=1 Tax=Halomonas lysinitropha TaxID=2607506 RepID=UPI001788C11B|nr:GspH/FimT family pseudopilin [Halomonas lysinitropha]